MTHVVILGAGPAGAGAAWKLRERGVADATLVERLPLLGGNAGSFRWNGHVLDFGSHRLHPACEPAILADIQRFLGPTLLDRPRHGRIRLLGKWIHFPLKPADLLLHLPPSFAIGSAMDAATKFLPKGGSGEETFASVLGKNLGKTICKHFYYPYAKKIWGRDPETLSAIQARRRVSAGSFLKIVKKVLGQVPGLKKKGAGRFWYPEGGFGAITEAYAAEAKKAGANVLAGWSAAGLIAPGGGEKEWTVHLESNGEKKTIRCDQLWSTLPITTVAKMTSPAAPAEVTAAANALVYRAMVLVYLELDVEQFSEYDAHYFPGADLVMTRMSEPKNYAVRKEPKGKTVLCAEVPCDVGDRLWTMDDAGLGRLVAEDLRTTGLPLARPPIAVTTRRLPQAYPIYLTGYERHFETLDRWAQSLPQFLSFGRQGLFAHDNTHHALAMAYGAVDCLKNGAFDRSLWSDYRTEFAKHVVED